MVYRALHTNKLNHVLINNNIMLNMFNWNRPQTKFTQRIIFTNEWNYSMVTFDKNNMSNYVQNSICLQDGAYNL